MSETTKVHNPLERWKQAYYRHSAKNIASDSDDAGLVEHALLKWSGLRPEVLKRFGLPVTDYGALKYAPPGLDFNSDLGAYEKIKYFYVDADSCALCIRYLERDDNVDWADPDTVFDNKCEGCPLAASRGDVPCDRKADDEMESPYRAWLTRQDPEPMIAALEKAMDYAMEEPT